MNERVRIGSDTIVLGALLKLAGVVESGGRAKVLVREGLVCVNGVIERRRGARIRPGDVVRVEGAQPATIHVSA